MALKSTTLGHWLTPAFICIECTHRGFGAHTTETRCSAQFTNRTEVGAQHGTFRVEAFQFTSFIPTRIPSSVSVHLPPARICEFLRRLPIFIHIAGYTVTIYGAASSRSLVRPCTGDQSSPWQVRRHWPEGTQGRQWAQARL